MYFTTPLGKIDTIKVVRLITNLGLVDAKIIAERWLEAMGRTGIQNLEDMISFLQFLGMFSKGLYKVENGRIYPSEILEISDNTIREVSKK